MMQHVLIMNNPDQDVDDQLEIIEWDLYNLDLEIKADDVSYDGEAAELIYEVLHEKQILNIVAGRGIDEIISCLTTMIEVSRKEQHTMFLLDIDVQPKFKVIKKDEHSAEIEVEFKQV